MPCDEGLGHLVCRLLLRNEDCDPLVLAVFEAGAVARAASGPVVRAVSARATRGPASFALPRVRLLTPPPPSSTALPHPRPLRPLSRSCRVHRSDQGAGRGGGSLEAPSGVPLLEVPPSPRVG